MIGANALIRGYAKSVVGPGHLAAGCVGGLAKKEPVRSLQKQSCVSMSLWQPEVLNKWNCE